MGVGLKLPPFINLLCGQMGRPCPDVSIITLVSKSVDISDGIVNLIYRYGAKITPDINTIYVGLERSCPRDSTNVS